MHDIHAEITNQIIEQLERLQDQSQFTLPWHHPHGEFPKNALTERSYRGSNCIILWVMTQARGRFSNRWSTYKQWQKLGGQVRKGERSVKITVPLIFKDHDEVDMTYHDLDIPPFLRRKKNGNAVSDIPKLVSQTIAHEQNPKKAGIDRST